MQSALDILLNDQHGEPALPKLLKCLVESVNYDWRQAKANLIENNQLWFGHQRSADGEHLLFAARQRCSGIAATLVQCRKQLVDLVKTRLPVGGHIVARSDYQVLLDR